MPKTTRTVQPTPTDPYTTNINQGSISISPQTSFTSTATGTCCSHQFKVIMMNGQYITYCERCGKIGDTRNVFPDPSNNYFTTGTPNYLTPNYLSDFVATTPTTVTTPGITTVGNSDFTKTSIYNSLRTDNITF